MLAAVLSVFTAVAAVVPAAAVEGTVSQHYDGEIKGQGQSIEYKFGIGISGDFEFTVGGALEKYGIQFYDATGHKYVDESCHTGKFADKFYISAGTYYVAYVSADNATGSCELGTTKAVFGDFKNDNKIDVNDVTILQMFISGGHKFSDLKVLSADLDGDGLVMVTDVTHLQMAITAGAESM